MPKDSGGLVDALIATGESCGVELACLPHLRAVAEELVTGKPSASVEPFMHEAWRPSLTGVMALVPVLIRDTLVQSIGPRLYGAMIVLLEAMTQADADAYDHAKAILNDTRELGAVLREMEAGRALGDHDAHDPRLLRDRGRPRLPAVGWCRRRAGVRSRSGHRRLHRIRLRSHRARRRRGDGRRAGFELRPAVRLLACAISTRVLRAAVCDGACTIGGARSRALIAAQHALLDQRLALRVAVERLAAHQWRIARARLREEAWLQRLLGLACDSDERE